MGESCKTWLQWRCSPADRLGICGDLNVCLSHSQEHLSAEPPVGGAVREI